MYHLLLGAETREIYTCGKIAWTQSRWAGTRLPWSKRSVIFPGGRDSFTPGNNTTTRRSHCDSQPGQPGCRPNFFTALRLAAKSHPCGKLRSRSRKERAEQCFIWLSRAVISPALGLRGGPRPGVAVGTDLLLSGCRWSLRKLSYLHGVASVCSSVIPCADSSGKMSRTPVPGREKRRRCLALEAV